MKDKIKVYIDRARGFLGKLSGKTKKLILAATAAILIFSVAAAFMINNKEYEVLFTGLNDQEASEIIGKLQESAISYKFEEGGTILVPAEQEQKLKAQLVYEGYPKSGFTYNVFKDNIDLMTTDFEKDNYKLFELQDRIGSTISLFDGVKDAKVTIALGEDRKYVLDSKNATDTSASIVVVMKDGGSPTPEQVKGIQRLVAKSIPQLEMENIVVIDGEGNDVSVAPNLQTELNQLRAEFEKQVENSVKAKVANVLAPFYGADNVKVSVKAKVDMNKKIRETVNYFQPDSQDETQKDVNGEVAAEAEGTEAAAGTDDQNQIKRGIPSKESINQVSAGMTASELALAMRKEGISATSSGNDVEITENDAVKAEQTGTGITANNEALNITGADATKAKLAVTVSTGTAAESTLTINYIDDKGKEQAAEIKYTGTAADTTNGDAIRKAITDDETLSNLFTIGGTGAEITLETKVVGTGNAVIKGLSTTDAAVTQKVVVTEAQDKGTELKFGDDSLGNQGNFKNGDTVEVNGKTYEFTDGLKPVGSGNQAITLNAAVVDNMKALESALKEDGITVSRTGTGDATTLRIADFSPVSKIGGGLELQVGDTSQTFNKVAVKIDSMGTENLGIKDINVGTQEGASEAMDKIKAAINQVSGTRGELGAIQNRLEHTINNLGVAQENMTAAESRVRDVDMAKEMMNFTKNNILVQASQAMLAQANQQPQGVLQLLR